MSLTTFIATRIRNYKLKLHFPRCYKTLGRNTASVPRTIEHHCRPQLSTKTQQNTYNKNELQQSTALRVLRVAK